MTPEEMQALAAKYMPLDEPDESSHANGHDVAPGEPPDDGWEAPTEVPNNISSEEASEGKHASATDIEFVTPAEWPAEPPRPVEWLARDRIPLGDVSGLGGDGGSGKTDIALQLSANVARHAPDWLGCVIEGGSVAFLSAEEPEPIVRWRLHRLGERDGYDPRMLRDLHFWFPDDLREWALAVRDPKTGAMRATSLLLALEKRIAAIGPKLVVLDNVAAVFAGNQLDRVHARAFVNLFRSIARGPSRPAVLLLDHPSLSGITSGTGRGGNMDWRNGMRSALYLRPADDKVDADAGVRILETVKSNYGPIGEKVRLRWSNGGLAVEGTPTAMRQAAREREAEEKFLQLLALHNRLGIDVGYSTGRGYAPKVFSEHPESGGYSSKAMAAAMQRLLSVGKIELEAVGPPSKGKKRLVIAKGEKAS